MARYNLSLLRITVPLLVMLLFLPGCATVMPEGTEVQMERTSFSFAENQQPYNLLPAYRIAPGDVLDILYQVRSWIGKEDFRLSLDNEVKVKFIHADELNTTQRVLPNGNIILPYVGEVHVVGKTVDELADELKVRYKDILQIPEISVTVPDFRSLIKELKADLHTAPRGLSRLTTVRPDGYATFPGIQDVFVAGKTIPEVSGILNDMYQKRLPGIHCDLFLEKHSGSLVYVVGEVNKPGAYPVIKPITVLEAMALAGSYLPGASLNSIIVVRKHENKMVATRVNLSASLSFAQGGRMFFLQPDDIVYVPKRWITEAAEVMQDISKIILFRGWGLGFSWELHDAGPGDSNLDF